MPELLRTFDSAKPSRRATTSWRSRRQRGEGRQAAASGWPVQMEPDAPRLAFQRTPTRAGLPGWSRCRVSTGRFAPTVGLRACLEPCATHSIALASLLALAACSSASSGGFHEVADGATSAEAAPGADASSPLDAGGSDRTVAGDDASTGGGSPDADAAADASPCAALGGSCADPTFCLCGSGAGCAFDNVTCSDAGRCVLIFAIDGGDGCCASCEAAFEQGASVATWLACNDACGAGGCPARCAAQP